MKTKVIAYWTSIVILEFVLLSGGAAQLLRFEPNVEGMQRLGYPLYMMTILGFWKVLGGVALLIPRFPRVQEWAYAGIFFIFTGAVASHVASGDSVAHFIAPLIFAVVTVASWVLRPASRRLVPGISVQ
jgi:uncharacterized membrane protein YphA (DoxX/SURF4 family)